MKSSEMPFRTRIEVPRMGSLLTLRDRHVFLGSCFADNIGQRFVDYGLQALVNPVGVLYNPESIRRVIRQALQPTDLPLFKTGREWRCWLTATLLGGKTREECQQAVSGAFLLLGQALREATHLFLTLGTNVCYRLQDSGLVVSNCHKQPQTSFSEVALSLSECQTALQELLQLLWQVNPSLQVIFTVSPYRYAKYGFHRSQLAKSTLLLAIDAVCTENPERCHYLPAYEVVMDELRDYRFYADDMIHPSHVAVDYLWSRVVESCMDDQMQRYLTDYEPIRRARLHRPLHPDSPQYQTFLQTIQQQESQIRKKYSL